MALHDRVIVRRPTAVSTSLFSTAAVDVDLHVVLGRPLPDIAMVTTFVRVSFHEERVAVDLRVSQCEVAPETDASALAAATALALRRDSSACGEFIRRGLAAVTILRSN